MEAVHVYMFATMTSQMSLASVFVFCVRAIRIRTLFCFEHSIEVFLFLKDSDVDRKGGWLAVGSDKGLPERRDIIMFIRFSTLCVYVHIYVNIYIYICVYIQRWCHNHTH